MRWIPSKLASLLAAVLGTALCGSAQASAGLNLGAALRESAAFLRADVQIRSPPAHVAFCRSHPDECRDASPAVLAFDEATRRLVAEVNSRINSRIQPRPDDPGTDTWTLNAETGDCDDYAVQKRHELVAAGLAPGALLLAVARLANGEAHLVLVVRTSAGDFVLDNLTRDIRPWFATDYRWVAAQQTGRPRAWAAIERPEGRPLPAPVEFTLPASIGTPSLPQD